MSKTGFYSEKLVSFIFIIYSKTEKYIISGTSMHEHTNKFVPSKRLNSK